jgi:hypothetical protein
MLQVGSTGIEEEEEEEEEDLYLIMLMSKFTKV